MKRKTLLYTIVLPVLLLAVLSACGDAASGGDEPTNGATLKLVTGGGETDYTREELEALGQVTVEAEGNAYVGVRLADLLQDAGVDPAQLGTVTSVAADGFSAEYDGELVRHSQTIVAYATTEGELAGDEQPFRMVLPEQPGRMNVRMLERIEVGG